MSEDRQVLMALALKLQKEIKYFEVVSAAFGPDKKKCYLCLGQHAAFFMQQNMNNKVEPKHSAHSLNNGELKYEHISKVIKDTASDENLALILEQNSGWKFDRISIRSEDRDLLLQHLRCSWQTDNMWRVNKVANFPLFEKPISKPDKSNPWVRAFKGHRWITHQGYKMMLPEGYVQVSTAIQAEGTREYLHGGTGVTLALKVNAVTRMEDLAKLNREHLRWVAAEYKAHLVREESNFYILRNCLRHKRMNLVGDMAAWYCWELIIRTQDATFICILLRRQYIPPLCDCAQDLALTVRCPMEEWRKSELQVTLQAQVLADSLIPIASCTVYPQLVQAKLDALRFDEDGTEWISNHLRIASVWRGKAKEFVRTIINAFVESKIVEKDLLKDKKYLMQTSADEEWEEVALIPREHWDPDERDSVNRYVKGLKAMGSGLPEPESSRNEDKATSNRWLARVARYFAWALDGGLLGSRFTIDWMIERMPSLNPSAEKQVTQGLMFILHLRSSDWQSDWCLQAEEAGKSRQLIDELKSISDLVLNDRVMQQMISADYLRKNIGRQRDVEYCKCLAHLLKSGAGINLKAYICRIFMEMRVNDEANVVALPGLLFLLDSGSLYLATYACAALVNLSHKNEMVKMQLMSHSLPQLAVANLKTKDEDLICYTLTLMVNLTKEAHHRYIMAKAGVLPLLYDILTSTYSACNMSFAGGNEAQGSLARGNSVKEKNLSHVCGLLGHFCKDEVNRDHIIQDFKHAVKCVMYIATHSRYDSPAMSNSLYALQQLCATRTEQKMIIGATVLKPLIKMLDDPEVVKNATPELLNHAVVLLNMLGTYTANLVKMDEPRGFGREVLKKLKEAPAGKKIERFTESIDQLSDNILRELERAWMP